MRGTYNEGHVGRERGSGREHVVGVDRSVGTNERDDALTLGQNRFTQPDARAQQPSHVVS